ncbi:hypothetical protein D3C76_692020 [compost metagenome]
MNDARDRQVALFVHVRHTAQARAGHGGTVIAVLAADDDFLVRLALDRPIVTNHAQHGVVAFRAGTGEEHVVHAFWRDIGDGLGQLQYRRVGGLEEQVVVRQFAHLLAGGIGQFIATVTDGHAPQAGHAVEDLVAFAVPDINAVGLFDDAWAFFLQLLVVAEGRQVVVIAQGLPLEGLGVADVVAHCFIPTVINKFGGGC